VGGTSSGYFVGIVGYDSALYGGYRLKVPRAGRPDTVVAFMGQPTIPNGEYIVQIGTPQWKHSVAAATSCGS